MLRTYERPIGSKIQVLWMKHTRLPPVIRKARTSRRCKRSVSALEFNIQIKIHQVHITISRKIGDGGRIRFVTEREALFWGLRP